MLLLCSVFYVIFSYIHTKQEAPSISINILFMFFFGFNILHVDEIQFLFQMQPLEHYAFGHYLNQEQKKLYPGMENKNNKTTIEKCKNNLVFSVFFGCFWFVVVVVFSDYVIFASPSFLFLNYF